MHPVSANYIEAIHPGKSPDEIEEFFADVNFSENYVLLVLDHM
jgi:hypothetical protein